MNTPLFDPRRSLVVVAGAGTGKTWSLVRRYLRLVGTNGPDGFPWAHPDEVLAVTFTRAAAVEMRSRVLTALAADPWSIDPSDEVVFALHHQVQPVDRVMLSQALAGAPIDTLHGLCSRLLREFPELSGVDPDARPVEPGEDAVWRGIFLGRFLDEILDDPAHALHADVSGLLMLRPLSEIRTELTAVLYESRPPDVSWGDPEAVRELRSSFLSRQWERIPEVLIPSVSNLLTAIEAVRAAGPREDDWALRKDADTLRQALRALESGRRGAVAAAAVGLEKIWPGEDSGPVQDARSRLWRALRCEAGVGRPLVTSLPERDDPEHPYHVARWARVGRAASEAYAEFLQGRALLRFDDLEARTLDLLEHRGAREYLRGRFTHLLVDEFQDTNRVQVRILEKLAEACGGLTTFFVGDPKQSIYRFRGAEVEVFEAELAGAAAAGEGAAREVALLQRTWRTSQDLTDFFNRFYPSLFQNQPQVGDQELSRGLDDRARVPWEPVRCARELDGIEGPPVALMMYLEGKTPKAASRVPEPRRVAAALALLLSGTPLTLPTGEVRRLRPSDVALLLPKWRHAEAYRAALEEAGVPAELAGGKGLLQLPEVRDLTNLLRFLGSWDDELAAAAVLRGPMFGVSDAGLYVLARGPGVLVQGGLSWVPWEQDEWPLERPRSLRSVSLRGRLDAGAAVTELGSALRIPADEMLVRLQGDSDALEAGRAVLGALVAGAGRRLTAELLADAVAAFRLEAHWRASPRGARAVANAWKFVELVRAFEADGPDIDGLIAWTGGEAEPAPEGRLSGDADAVTITTVHGAKGLEWPVVVMAGLGQWRGGRGVASWRSSPVPGLDPDDPLVRLPRVARPTGGFHRYGDPLDGLCETLSRPKEAAENKRLLYVGMTRAADLLILSGEVKPWAGRGNDGRIKPLAWCRTEADYLVAVLGLRPDEAGRLHPDPEWADWAVQVEEPIAGADGDDAEPDAAIAPVAVPEQAPEIEAPPDDPALLAWRPSYRARTWTPSAGRLPWKGATARWSDPGPLPSPVLVPDRDPRLTGTLFHAVVERWNFHGPPPDRAACVAQVRGLVDEAQAHGEWLADCVALLAGGMMGERLQAAALRGELFHEVDLDAFTGLGDRITGRLDLLWREDNGMWAALDYKVTARLDGAEDLQKLQEEYGPQLRAYREALMAWKPGEIGRLGLWLAPVGRPLWVEGWEGKPGERRQLKLF